MGFNLAEQVEALDWDFSTMKGAPAELVDARGTIPEPTVEQIDKFARRWQGLVRLASETADAAIKKITDAEAPTEDAGELSLEQKLERWSTAPDVTADEKNALKEALIDLCMIVCERNGRPLDGAPTREHLYALGGRERTAFVQWLVVELVLDPKAQASNVAMSAQSFTSSTPGS